MQSIKCSEPDIPFIVFYEFAYLFAADAFCTLWTVGNHTNGSVRFLFVESVHACTYPDFVSGADKYTVDVGTFQKMLLLACLPVYDEYSIFSANVGIIFLYVKMIDDRFFLKFANVSCLFCPILQAEQGVLPGIPYISFERGKGRNLFSFRDIIESSVSDVVFDYPVIDEHVDVILFVAYD